VQSNDAVNSKNFIRESFDNPVLGNITGMLLNLSPLFSDAYIYSDVMATKVRKATLKYKIGDGEWKQQSDAIYPYEFSIHLADPKQKLTYIWVSEDLNGKITESKEMELSN